MALGLLSIGITISCLADVSTGLFAAGCANGKWIGEIYR